MTDFQVAVIGGGIVGLAAALRLTERYPDCALAVLEKEPTLAAHQTGHNSGVIHSGLYYRPGSHKARLCVQGARMLMEFCRERDIPYRQCGKVVVAADESELPRLEALRQRGIANGLEGLEMLGPDGLKDYEPYAAGAGALLVPSTGVVDFSRVAHAYADLVRERGGQVRTGTELLDVRRSGDTLRLLTSQGEMEARYLINCAGLYSDAVARMAGARPSARIIPFRGEYYTIRPERGHLVRTLIYPVPDPRFPFLGVHFTRRITGEVEAGPNAVLALAREGYARTSVSPSELLGALAYPGFWRMGLRHWRTGLVETRRSLSKAAFLRDLQRLLPSIVMDDLAPGGAGVRAQAVDARGVLLDDFVIAESPGAIHVLNAPSPAATSSLAIGDHIADLAARSFGLGPADQAPEP